MAWTGTSAASPRYPEYVISAMGRPRGVPPEAAHFSATQAVPGIALSLRELVSSPPRETPETAHVTLAVSLS
jgi:hypothetical protein